MSESLTTCLQKIDFIKTTFEKLLESHLDLIKVNAPLFVSSKSGLNDNLTGIETKITFTPKHIPEKMEIV